MTLVERIAKLCAEQGTTMTAIERENGLAVSSIRKWNNHAPTIPKLMIVAKALNTTVSYLTGETDIKNPDPQMGAGMDDLTKDILSELEGLSDAELLLVKERIKKIKESRE